jgi:hypothetical protein
VNIRIGPVRRLKIETGTDREDYVFAAFPFVPAHFVVHTLASLGRDDVKEYAFMVVLQVGQIVGEIGEIVANAGLHVLAEAMICP